MRLSPARFNAQLAEMGQPMLWRRSSLCPCRDPHTGGADATCPRCDGRGVFWHAGIRSVAGVVGARATRQFADFARWEDGDVVLSIPGNTPMWDAAENDRVLFLVGEQSFAAQLIHDGTARLDMAVVRLVRCFWLGPQGTAEIDCDLPRIDPMTRLLSWANAARAPDPGARFSLQGVRRPEYFLYRDIPITRAHFGGLSLPKRVVLKRFDLFKG